MIKIYRITPLIHFDSSLLQQGDVIELNIVYCNFIQCRVKKIHM